MSLYCGTCCVMVTLQPQKLVLKSPQKEAFMELNERLEKCKDGKWMIEKVFDRLFMSQQQLIKFVVCPFKLCNQSIESLLH